MTEKIHTYKYLPFFFILLPAKGKGFVLATLIYFIISQLLSRNCIIPQECAPDEKDCFKIQVTDINFCFLDYVSLNAAPRKPETWPRMTLYR